MEESDSDSSDYMSSIDVFDSEVSNSGCEEYYSCDEGDDNEAQPLKLRCVICKKGVASDGELRKHTEAEENHANIRSRIGFKCLSDLAHVCFQASIANAARESQLQNEQAISQVESVDSANNAGEKENGSSSDAMHPDSPSINTEDEEDADDEEEQVQPSTSAGLGTGRILSRDTKSSTNNEEDSDKDGDSAEDLENNGDHDDDDANDDNLELQPRKVTEDNHEWNCESQTHPLIPSTTPEVHLVLIGDNAEEKENGSSSDILHPDSPSTNTDDEEDDEEEQVLPSTSATLEKGRIIFMDSQSNTNNQVDNDQDGDRAEDLENGEYDDDHAYAKKPYTSNISTNVLYSTPVDDNVELQPRNANDDHHEWNCESQTHPLSPSTTPEVYLVLMPNHTEEIEVRPPSIRVPELTSYNAEKEQPSTSAGVEAGGMIAAHSQSKTNNAEDNEEDNDGARGGEDLEDGDHDDNDELGENPYSCNISTNVFYSTQVDEDVELQLRKATEDHHEVNCESHTQPLTSSTTPEVHLVIMPNPSNEIEVAPSIRVPDQDGPRGGDDLEDGDHDDNENGEKPYSCKICPNVFYSTIDSLRHHIESVHDSVELLVREWTKDHLERNCKSQTQPLTHPTPPMSPESSFTYMPNTTEEMEIEIPLSVPVPDSISCNTEAELTQPSTFSEHEMEVSPSNMEISRSNSPTRDLPPVSPPPKNKKRTPIPVPDYITVIAGDPVKYECTLCLRNFKTKANIAYHRYCQEGSGEKPFTCQSCGEGFVSKNHYEYHLRTHTGERPYKCTKCGKAFNQRGKVTRHMRSHTGEKPFVCQECNKRFSTAQALRCHTVIHTGERPFECTYCKKRFTCPTNLKKHNITHTGERRFCCDHCGKRFGLKWTLDLHLRTHSNERPHNCDQCIQTFKNRKDLQRHRLIHLKKRPFKCKICPSAFPRRDNFVRHHELVHQTSKEVAKKLASDAFADYQHAKNATNSNSVVTSNHSYSEDAQPSTSAGIRASSKSSQVESEVSKKRYANNKDRRGNRSDTILKPSTPIMSRGTKRKHVKVPAPVAPPNCRRSKRLLEMNQYKDSSNGSEGEVISTTSTLSDSSPPCKIKEASPPRSTSPLGESSDPTLVPAKKREPTLTLVTY